MKSSSSKMPLKAVQNLNQGDDISTTAVCEEPKHYAKIAGKMFEITSVHSLVEEQRKAAEKNKSGASR